MATDGYRWFMSWRGVMAIVIATYALVVTSIFLHKHLRIPRGKHPESLAGEYVIADKTNLRIPEVFRGEKLTIREVGNGKMSVTNRHGEALPLTQGADGLYFSEDFGPVGAWILPGIARNWNEGRIIKSNERIFVDGYMLEKGLMLFFIPFKDVMNWRIELKPAAEPSVMIQRSLASSS